MLSDEEMNKARVDAALLPLQPSDLPLCLTGTAYADWHRGCPAKALWDDVIPIRWLHNLYFVGDCHETLWVG